MTTKSKDIIAFLGETYPHAGCTLNFNNAYECLVAVMLSAQTNDNAVNAVSPALFSAYPNPASLAKAKESPHIKARFLWCLRNLSLFLALELRRRMLS